MSIQKKEYELSIWSEILGENGQKIERKEYIIGAHDMDYLGRATNIKLTKKLNGTHSLTFQMPDKWYDHEKGEYIRNEFVEQLFNEKKVKLHYMDEWYEFYIKNVKDDKKFKSYMKTYTCSDAFIDELSRNGYGITFDEELYNNVEEIGTFTEEILEDSIWQYSPRNNWGDFTEYIEEKMYRIPVSLFGNQISGYELNYNIENLDEDDFLIINRFTGEKRPTEMGDDLASGKYFWDQYNEKGIIKNKVNSNYISNIENDGYIYVFYTDLNFCFQTTQINLTATEEVQYYDNYSYALAPKTVDPNALIQFMAFPKNVILEVDEAGMIVNKNYHYVMTIEQWNAALEEKGSKYFYQFETLDNTQNKNFLTRDQALEKSSAERQITGNWCVYYEDYLSKIGNSEVLTGKKISIADRTEINITKNIDQYVTVYNNKWDDDNFKDSYVVDGEEWHDGQENIEYRVCSKIDTRQVVPQLARNLVENAVNIQSTDGWLVAASPADSSYLGATINFSPLENEQTFNGILSLTPSTKSEQIFVNSYQNSNGKESVQYRYKYSTFINFGIVGQEYQIKKEKIYCLSFNGEGFMDADSILIGEGIIKGEGEYDFSDSADTPLIIINIKQNFSSNHNFYFIKFDNNYDNPYLAISLDDSSTQTERKIKGLYFFEAYTKGQDQFDMDDNNPPYYKYSGRELFKKDIIWRDDNIIGSAEISIINQYSEEDMRSRILFEDTIMPGDTYEYQRYFIQQLYTLSENGNYNITDTFKSKEFLSPYGNLSSNQLPYSSEIYTDDDLVISTKYINLNQCKYYTGDNGRDVCDCCYGNKTGETEPRKMCMYQKYGYCPYLFQTEKHCRKIRTLKGEKSNRFNLTQELGKVFEVYPVYYIDHEENGKVKKRDNNSLSKDIFFITEKGSENKLGFRYELNLSNISRTIKSDQIVTKLYVNDVDSSISRTGLCSIKTAEDNPSKDSFIMDFSYYVSKGILNEQAVKEDLYGVANGDIGYLKQLGHYNSEYDKLSDLIINLSSQSFVELQANVDTDFQAITTAQQQLQKIRGQLNRYTTMQSTDGDFSDSNSAYMYAWNIACGKTLYNSAGGRLIEDSAKYLYPDDEDSQNYYKSQIQILSNFYTLHSSLLKKPDKYMALYIGPSLSGDEGIGCIKFLFQDITYSENNEEKKLFDLFGDSERSAAAFLSQLLTRDGVYHFKIQQNQSYENQQNKVNEQLTILNETMLELFGKNYENEDKIGNAEEFSVADFQKTEAYIKHKYNEGMLGQFNKEYNQLQNWKKRQSMYLRLINSLTLRFFKKYEPYLKEGTWSDSNYLTDNAYYFGAKEVAAEGAIPKVEYTISVVDLYALPEYEDHKFDIADTTYIEDIGMFGVNEKTGLPNRLKVLISEITYDLDQPKNNSIKIQNFTTQFEDLFQQVSASVQSLSFNENIYKRSSNFTSNQSIKEESLQGALNSNNLTLINTQEHNISIDAEGQSGSDLNNHSNQYKLNGQGMFFSNNGGQTWNVGVGPNGINADYIKVGTLDAGKIKIVDNDYLYFLWDKDGIIAFREPQKNGETDFNDFAVFNKYGLSLIQGGKIRMRSGYSYTGEDGAYTASNPLGEDIGFYLYNNNGKTTFSTVAGNNSSRLLLSGEMLASAASFSTSSASRVYTDGFVLKEEEAYSQTSIAFTGDEGELDTFGNVNILNFSTSPTSYEVEIVYKDFSGNLYRKINEEYKLIEKIENIKIKQSTEIEDKTINNVFEIVNISYYENKNQIIEKGVCYQDRNNLTHYYKNYRMSESTSGNPDASIGVFINNQAMGEGNINKKRLFSCLKKEHDKLLTNLFTIFESGRLVIGGKFTNKAEDITQVPYELELNENADELKNTIRIDNGQIYLGTKALTDMISQAASNLPDHRHEYYRHNDYYYFGRQSASGQPGHYQGWDWIPLQDNNGEPGFYVYHYIDEDTEWRRTSYPLN